MPYYAVKLYDGSEFLHEKCWYASTNGLAAASTREDAILGGALRSDRARWSSSHPNRCCAG